MPSSSFFWFDLMTPDIAGARSFYGALTGWTTESMMDGAYNVIHAGSVGVGGIMSNASPDGSLPAAPPSWLGYIWVEDVDATVARAQKLGAKQLVAARDIPGVGRFGIMQDPLGAAFAPFRPAPPPGAQHNPHMSETRGHMAWAELYTSDWQKAWQFYSALLGWQQTEQMDMGAMGKYVLFNFGEGAPVGGMMTVPNMPAQWLFYITVDDADAAAKKIVETGGKVVNGPMDTPGGGRAVQCSDPQGVAFGVFSHKS